MTMIEKVARAIASASGAEDWTQSLPAARAAVLALSEPTKDMLEAAMPDFPDYGFLEEEYKAMLRHAVEESRNELRQAPLARMVEPGGIEPPTSCMPCKRSTN
jgi:hypothetical protein